MEKEFSEEDVGGITEDQARRLVEWIVDHGHTKGEAYYALAYVMNAAVDETR